MTVQKAGYILDELQYPARTHAGKERTCKLHAEKRLWVGIKPSCCEKKVLTIATPYCMKPRRDSSFFVYRKEKTTPGSALLGIKPLFYCHTFLIPLSSCLWLRTLSIKFKLFLSSSEFPQYSGHLVCLTCERSPVRNQVETGLICSHSIHLAECHDHELLVPNITVQLSASAQDN